MTPERYDLVVIGGGLAGQKAATLASRFGKRVALIETEPHLGGTGINTGAIPAQTLRETASYLSGLRQRGLHRTDQAVRPGLTVRDLMLRERQVVAALREKAARDLARHRITVIQGFGVFEDPRTIRARSDDHPDRFLSGDAILIATGTRPYRAQNVGFDDRLILDSDSILRMHSLPRHLAVVGAGIIGCEYASMFSALGIDVTLLAGRDRILPFLDCEISDRLRVQMELLGIRIRLGTAVDRYDPLGDHVQLSLSTGETVQVDRVLVAAGRCGNTEGLDLPRAGVTPDARGLIRVNEHHQTALSHVYAAGSVIGFPGLAAVSMEQARSAVCHAFGLTYETPVGPVLPLAVFTIPEVAMVGETEETCQHKHIPYCVGRAFYDGNTRGLIIGDLSGQLKLIFSPVDQALLGVHVIGELASELIHVGQACLQLGAALDYFAQAAFNYPTLGEAYRHAAEDGFGNLARMKAGERPGRQSEPLRDLRAAGGGP